MRKAVFALILLLAGCAGGVYKVPTEEYRQQVKTLGVLPVLVDARSTINHPQAGEIVDLLWRAAEGQSERLVLEMRKKKGYFDVRRVNEPARLVADRLLLRPQHNELGQPLGYQLDQTYLAELCRDAVVDGVLILALQGAVHNDKRWSRNTFENLVTDYNDILATASVVAADGRVLWEMSGESAERVLTLQYADFDEAFYNKTDSVRVRFIGLDGLSKTLFPPTSAEGQQQPAVAVAGWLDKVGSALSPSLFR